MDSSHILRSGQLNVTPPSEVYCLCMEEKEIPEILLIDKPKGITSFDVIRALRKRLNIKKMGHAGTLDPNATGLMIIGIAGGTKKLDEYLKLSKTYEADILLGVRTDTGDIDGSILEERDGSGASDESIREAVRSIEGVRTFRVPMYSAIKIKGKPLYAYAREGKKDMAPEKEMRVERAEVQRIAREKKQTIVSVVFDVGSGTYIRTLAEEIGRYLGLPTTLKDLRRTRIGNFSIENAKSIDVVSR